jgi:UDP-N-acetylglucosamine:LPS N-acetylglucosamine transferase
MRDDRQRILLVFSDVGAGHRAAVRAIERALHDLFPNRVETRAVDIFAECGSFPVSRFPQGYSRMFEWPRLWGWLYRATDSPQRFDLLVRLAAGLVTPRWTRLLAEYRPDVVVSALPNVNGYIGRTLRRQLPAAQFGVVMTELVSIHAAWVSPDVDWWTASSDAAAAQAIAKGMPATRGHITGQPVDLPYAAPCDRAAVRARLGMRPECPTVLLAAGGAGRGGLEPLLRALDARLPAGQPAHILVVCGRNERLRARLAAERWQQDVRVMGFVTNMRELMAAADVVATKGGSTSVAEALACALPIVLMSVMPGQEEGNVAFVEHAGAGIHAPSAQSAAQAIARLLHDAPARARMSANSRALARPDSARAIARIVMERHGCRSVAPLLASQPARGV